MLWEKKNSMRLWFAQVSLDGIGIPTLHKTLQPIYNKQGPTAQYRKFCSIFCNNLNRKWSESCSVVSNSLRPRLTDFSVQRILQARTLEWVVFSPLGDLPNPGIEPWSPAFQAGSLPAELSGKSREINGKRTWKRTGPRQIALLYTRNQHNTVNQLYSNIGGKNVHIVQWEKNKTKPNSYGLFKVFLHSTPSLTRIFSFTSC